MTFNYAAFKENWRAACERYHIDPVTGPSEYQVINVQVDLEKAARRQTEPPQVEPGTGAWLKAWSNKPTDVLRDVYGWSTDIDTGELRQVLRDASRIAVKLEPGGRSPEAVDPEMVGMQELREVWVEVLNEVGTAVSVLDRKQKAEIPLRFIGRYPAVYDRDRLFELSLPEPC